MQKIMIFHANKPTFEVNTDFVPNMRDYHHVANVSTDDLDTAYHLTNSVEKGWWQNEGVEFLGSRNYGMQGSRSSSIGDVFVFQDQTFVVVSFGFMDVTKSRLKFRIMELENTLRQLHNLVKNMHNPQTLADVELMILKFQGVLEHTESILQDKSP